MTVAESGLCLRVGTVEACSCAGGDDFDDAVPLYGFKAKATSPSQISFYLAGTTR